MERISIPIDDGLKQLLDAQVPRGERAIQTALEERKRKDALSYLLAIKPIKRPQDAVETLRAIRAE
jgi:hypothetical protein